MQRNSNVSNVSSRHVKVNRGGISILAKSATPIKRRSLKARRRGETDSIGMDSPREVGLIYEHSSARSLIKVSGGPRNGRQARFLGLLLSRALTVE